jgi:F0F1-type ATP synthase assembly protein I
MLPFGKSQQSPEEQNRMWRLAGMGWTLVTEIIAGMLIGLLFDWLSKNGSSDECASSA